MSLCSLGYRVPDGTMYVIVTMLLAFTEFMDAKVFVNTCKTIFLRYDS